MAFQTVPKSPSPASPPEEEEEKPQTEDEDVDQEIQLPRAAKNTDPGIESESEDEDDEHGQLEFVSSTQEREDAVYDASNLILPTVGESSTDNTLLENVELEDEEEEEDVEHGREGEEDEEEEEEEEDMEDQNQSKEEERRTDQKDLTLFSGLDHDDSDPDIDKLVAECDFLPEVRAMLLALAFI